MHGLQFYIGGLRVDDCHTAAAFSQRHQGVYRATVVAAVRAGMNNDHTLNAELIVQSQHIFEPGLIRRVLPVCGQRVACIWPENMRVAITAASGQSCVRRLMQDSMDGGRRSRV